MGDQYDRYSHHHLWCESDTVYLNLTIYRRWVMVLGWDVANARLRQARANHQNLEMQRSGGAITTGTTSITYAASSNITTTAASSLKAYPVSQLPSPSTSPKKQPTRRRRDNTMQLSTKEHLGKAVHFVPTQVQESAALISEVLRNSEDGPDVERVGAVKLAVFGMGFNGQEKVAEYSENGLSGTWHFPEDCLELDPEDDEEPTTPKKK